MSPLSISMNNMFVRCLSLILILCSFLQTESFSSQLAIARRPAQRGISSLSSPRTSSKLHRSHERQQQTSKAALLDPSIMVSAGSAVSPSNIHTAFSVATFFPQPFWLFIILLPKADFTKKLMGGMEVVTLCALVHLFIVGASLFEPGATAPLLEFNDVFNPAGDPQAAFMGMVKYPNFVAEEWSHVLTWDLFVGRWIWLDGLKRGVFTSHSVLLCNLIGPPGLLLHWATCFVTGKGIIANEALDNEN